MYILYLLIKKHYGTESIPTPYIFGQMFILAQLQIPNLVQNVICLIELPIFAYNNTIAFKNRICSISLTAQ